MVKHSSTLPRFIVLCLLLLCACIPQTPTPPSPVPASLTPSVTLTETPTLTPTLPPSLTPTFTETLPPSLTPIVETPLTPTPGLVLRGHVRLKNGPELAGVKICRSYASYDGVVLATTDTAGYFQSDFAFIPGDETVSVWPLAEGYTFEPPVVSWRHYYGPEDRTLDFVASPSTATAVPPVPCS